MLYSCRGTYNIVMTSMSPWFHRYLSFLSDPNWHTIIYSDRSGMFSWFHRSYDLSDLTKFSWDIGLSTLGNSVQKSVCMQDIIVMTSMSPQFHRYICLFDLTQRGRFIKILILFWTNGQTDTSIIYIRIEISGHPDTPPSSSCRGLFGGLRPLWEAFGLFLGPAAPSQDLAYV